jgi:hypothetical protein
VEKLYWEMVRQSHHFILGARLRCPFAIILGNGPGRILSSEHEANMRRNDGKLAEGWYDPQTLERAITSNTATSSGNSNSAPNKRPERDVVQPGRISIEEHNNTSQDEERDDNDDDDFGPTLPQSSHDVSSTASLSKPGPSIPKLHDLQHARELAAEDALSSRKQASKDLRADRKSEQDVRKTHLDELAPRAEPGTRERQLEKRSELAASNRAFASAKTDPTDVELPEADVMGGEEGPGELKRLKEMEERKRSEREIRRDEVMRARKEEREERVREMREKEEKTMEMLREIARVRFGGGAEGAGGGA